MEGEARPNMRGKAKQERQGQRLLAAKPNTKARPKTSGKAKHKRQGQREPPGYMHTHMPALAHRVSRPRGTGSVGAGHRVSRRGAQGQ